MEKIKLAYQDYYLGKHTQSEYTLQKALDKTFGEDVAQVTGEGPWTITTGDRRTYSLDSNGTVTPNSSGGGSSTSVAYEVGDVVRLGGEDFYVIERSDETKTTVKLLAKYNVKTESGEGQYTQRTDANTLRFDDNSNVYYDDTTNPVTEAEIKTHVDAYKTELEGRMGAGKTTQEVRLMLKEEVEALGGDADNHTTEGCPEFINKRAYWLGSPYEDNTIREWYVHGNSSSFNYNFVTRVVIYGLRPVVIVLKSNI